METRRFLMWARDIRYPRFNGGLKGSTVQGETLTQQIIKSAHGHQPTVHCSLSELSSHLQHPSHTDRTSTHNSIRLPGSTSPQVVPITHPPRTQILRPPNPLLLLPQQPASLQPLNPLRLLPLAPPIANLPHNSIHSRADEHEACADQQELAVRLLKEARSSVSSHMRTEEYAAPRKHR